MQRLVKTCVSFCRYLTIKKVHRPSHLRKRQKLLQREMVRIWIALLHSQTTAFKKAVVFLLHPSFGKHSSMRIRGLEQQQRRPLPAAETGRSCWGRVLLFQSPVKGLRKNQQTQPARPCRTVPQAINPVGLLLVRGSWTRRNVYREDCR